MKILVLIHEYPPIGGGGGRVAQDICEGLAARGHECTVLTPQFGSSAAEEALNGVRLLRLKCGRKEAFRAGLGAMLGYTWAAFWKGLQVARAWKPDAIHVHFAVPAGAAAWALSVVSGVPYVLTAHLGDVPGGVPEKTGRWFRWIFPFTPPIWKRAAAVVAVSQFTRRLALQHYRVPVEVIPNGVDLRQVDPGEIAVHTPPGLVFAGRFMEQKNPLLLVQVLARLQDLPWRCELIGDGPLRPQVQAEIERLGMQARFTLPGWLTPQQVLEGYRRSDILFMPSRSEGLPVVGVQALAMGLALVMSRVGGCVDLVEEGHNGSLLDPQDAAGFESALRALLSDRQRLLSARLASRRIASRFDLPAIVDDYEAILRKAAGSRP